MTTKEYCDFFESAELAKNVDALPNHPADLIRLAVLDLAAVAHDDRYRIDMSTWHSQMPGEPCHVCFAGSILACSLDVPIEYDVFPGALGVSVFTKFMALDAFRQGWIDRAFRDLGLPVQGNLPDKVLITSYKYDPEEFVGDMLNLAYMIDMAYAGTPVQWGAL